MAEAYRLTRHGHKTLDDIDEGLIRPSNKVEASFEGQTVLAIMGHNPGGATREDLFRSSWDIFPEYFDSDPRDLDRNEVESKLSKLLSQMKKADLIEDVR